MTIRNRPKAAAVFGVDIGKNLFHVVGLDEGGNPIQKATFRRETLLQFFEQAEPTLVGMEACPGSQWLARKIGAMGHKVRIIPAQFVKPYVKSNKNDIIDAAAIAEAVTRPTMRFVETRAPEQIDMQALHRVRERLVTHRTRMISLMRAFCLEYGIAIHQGAGKFKAELPRVLADESNDLSSAIRSLLSSVFDELKQLEERLAAVDREIGAAAAKSDTARRLMTIPGIGPPHGDGTSCCGGRCQAVSKGPRRGRLAWPHTSPALDRGEGHPARYQQTGQQVPAPALHPWRSIMRHPSRSQPGPPWLLAQ